MKKKILFFVCLICMCNMVFAQSGSGYGQFETNGFLGYLYPSTLNLNNADNSVSASLPEGHRAEIISAPPFFEISGGGTSTIVLKPNIQQLLVWNDGYEGSKVEFPVKIYVEKPKQGDGMRPWMDGYYGKFYIWKIYWES